MAKDPRIKNMIIEVLDKYKHSPVLWDKDHPLHKDKGAKLQAWESLSRIWRRVERTSMENVKNKVTNMRSTYFRDRKRVEESRAGGGAVFVPTLWYYSYMDFLSGEDEGPEPGPSRRASSGSAPPEAQPTNGAGGRDQREEQPRANLRASTNRRSTDRPHQRTPYARTQPPPPPQPTTPPQPQPPPPPQPQPQPSPHENTPEYAAGLFMSSQLKQLDDFQRVIAEKLISEIFFQAKIERLTIKTTFTGLRDEMPQAAVRRFRSKSMHGVRFEDASDAGPSNAGPSNAGRSNAGPSNASRSNAGPSNAGPSNAGPSNAGPSNAGPSNADPSNAGAARLNQPSGNNRPSVIDEYMNL